MKNERTIPYVVSALFSLIAISALYYLASQHWALKLGMGSAESLCNLNATFNCDAVSASRFASFFGIPIALWGALAYLSYLVSLSLGHFLNIERLIRHSFYLSNFFLYMSIIMGAISLLFMSTYCLFCILTYICSVVIFFATKKMNEDGYSMVKEDFSYMLGKGKSYLSIYLLIPILSFIIQDSTHGDSLRKIEEINKYVPQEWAASPAFNFTAEPTFVTGASDAEAKVVIVEFADFLCPHCKFASPTLKSFLKLHKDVQLRFYSFPLSSECNAAIRGPGAHRCDLAKTAFCGEKLAQKGMEVTTELFEGQGKYMSNNVISEISSKFSLNEEQLKNCVNSEEASKAIFAQAAEGQKANIKGTPSVFINGKQLPYGVRIPFMNAVYNEITK